MKKALVPSIILLMIAVVGIWVIRNEGDKTREAMRQTMQVPIQDAHQTVRDGMKEGVGGLVDDAKKLPGQVLGEIGGILDGKTGDVPTKPADVPAKVFDVLGGFLPNSKGKPASETDSTKNEKSQAPQPSERVRPQEMVAKAFQLVREAAKATDDAGQAALAIGPKEENELGQELRREFSQHFKFADRADQLDRIKRLAIPIIEQRTRKEIQYSFAIVDDPTLNAFSILGGSIYVHTGLLDRSPSDGELQGVLAHEVGHVDLKHCVRSFTYAVRTGEVGGILAESLTRAAYRTLSVAYSEDHEFEADEFAFRALVRADRSQDDSLAFTKFLLRAEVEAGATRETKSPKTVFDSIGHEISNHYRTHPPGIERVRRLEFMKDQKPNP